MTTRSQQPPVGIGGPRSRRSALRWLLSLCVTLTALPLGAPTTVASHLSQGTDTECRLIEGGTLRNTLAGPGAASVCGLDVREPGTRVQLDLIDLPADYDLYLVDEAGNVVDQSVHEGTTPESLDLTLASAGAFFVYVVADPGRNVAATAPYTLRFSLTAPVAEASPWKLLRADGFSDPTRGGHATTTPPRMPGKIRAGG